MKEFNPFTLGKYELTMFGSVATITQWIDEGTYKIVATVRSSKDNAYLIELNKTQIDKISTSLDLLTLIQMACAIVS